MTSTSRTGPVEAPLDTGTTTPTVERFRHVLGHVPTGVVVVTAVDSGEPVGLAVGTFVSVSLRPPLVAFLPASTSTSFPRIRAAGTFCVNVLTVEQQHVCRAFATPGGDKFANLRWHPTPATGAPRLSGAAAWIDCRIASIHEAGDHFIVLGEVLDLAATVAATPLLFHRGQYTAPAITQPTSAGATSVGNPQ
jgi:3-hydroxy-9,10-secoandrosta-1,3,5(10)-triene-9,17-dione monooxygenase reductase component